MNAIVVLCHFCEQHGPSVIMCTQPYKQLQAKSTPNTGTQQQTHDVQLDSNTIPRTTSHGRLQSTGVESVGRDGMPTVYLPPSGSSPALTKTKSVPTTSYQSSTQTNPSCKACSFVPRDEPGLISHDQAANTSYVSTQLPRDADLNIFVRNACLRSLSSEVYPNQEGAFYFGDEANGHVLSYNFLMHDSHARGFQSRFSFLILSWERINLLHLWPFLVSNLAKMASRLRSAALRVYNDETSDNVHTSSIASGSSTNTTAAVAPSRSLTSVPIGRCTTPPAPLPPIICGQAIAAGTAATTGSGGGEGQRHRRAADSDMRSLVDLTKDDQIFYRIHAWFTWLLRAAGRRWNIIPCMTVPSDEDSLIIQEERQALIAAGAEQSLSGTNQLTTTTTTSHKLSVGASSLSSHLSNSKSSQSCLVSSIGAVTAASTSGQMAVGKSLGLTSGAAQEETALALLVLSRLLSVLGVNPFARLVQHIAVGNQIIVQPLEDNLLGTLVVCALAKLLPKGCVRQVVNSSEYLAPFRCNLLSLTVDSTAPEPDWSPGDGVLFLATYYCHTGKDFNLTEPTEKSLMEYFINSLYFKLCSCLPSMDPELIRFKQNLSQNQTPSPVSAVCKRLVQPISASSYVDRIVQLLSLNPPLPDTTLDLALNAARQEWISHARTLYSFKRCKVPQMSGEEINRRWINVLASIGCSSSENASVARFWQGALSQNSRNRVCHVRKRAPNSTATSRRGSCSSSNADLTGIFNAASLTD